MGTKLIAMKHDKTDVRWLRRIESEDINISLHPHWNRNICESLIHNYLLILILYQNNLFLAL